MADESDVFSAQRVGANLRRWQTREPSSKSMHQGSTCAPPSRTHRTHIAYRPSVISRAPAGTQGHMRGSKAQKANVSSHEPR